MTCLEVRERITEHALGLLTKVDASEVERHLQWCPGCRKESSELEEGAARMALALPMADPSPSLETRVVERVRAAAGRIPAGGRGGGRLVAVTLAAALAAMGTTGWAIAERNHAQTLQERVTRTDQRLRSTAQALDSFKGRAGRTTTARLAPAPGGRGSGSAVIFSAPGVKDQIVISVLIPGGKGPYVVQLVDNSSAIKLGRLELGKRLVEGDWFMWKLIGQDLSRVVTITVLDNESRTVLTGTVKPYTR